MPSLNPETQAFYCRSMDILNEAGLPFLVGGAYALTRYTGIQRHTKDFDIFVRATDADRCLEVLKSAGYQTELTFPHWLGKAKVDEQTFIDIIYSSGNGVATVDDEWFEHATSDQVFNQDVLLIPPEEMIWSKGFIMERERFDGADIAHLLRHQAAHMDWDRLLRRFGTNWRVLYSHLVMFGFIYPGAVTSIPRSVMADLTARCMAAYEQPGVEDTTCHGTLLSRAQYLGDLETDGMLDARLDPKVGMSTADVALWTAGIAKDGPQASGH